MPPIPSSCSCGPFQQCCTMPCWAVGSGNTATVSSSATDSLWSWSSHLTVCLLDNTDPLAKVLVDLPKNDAKHGCGCCVRPAFGGQDNKLLEKSNLLVQAQAMDLRTGLSPWSAWEPPSPVLDPTVVLQTTKIKYQRQIAELKDLSGVLAYHIIELNTILKAKETELEVQRTRLASLQGQVSELEGQHQQLRGQMKGLGWGNSAVKLEYDALRDCYRCRECELRREVERSQELTESLVRKKAKAAEYKNYQNERFKRAKHDELSRQLKKVTNETISIDIGPEEVKPAKGKGPSQDFTKLEDCEKPGKRPFSYRLKRGNSVSSRLESSYGYVPACLVACLPSFISDIQEAHLSEVNAVKFCPSSTMLATGGTDKLIKLWNVVGGRLESVRTLEGANGSITSIEFDPMGCQILAASYNKAVQLWKIEDCKSRETLTGHTDKVTAAKFRSTRYQAVRGSRDRTVKEWDLGKGACCRTIDVCSYCNDVVCWENIIVSGHHDKKIRFWDSRGPRCTEVIPVEGKVTSLHISQDQMHLLSCSRDNTLKVIDLKMNNVRQVFSADGFKCGSDWTKAIFSPDKSYILAGSSDGTLYVWSMENGKLVTSLPGLHGASVNAVAWSPSGQHVVSVDQGKKVVLWK
ncbi:autophagy-related protein 16-2 isoform X2 [Alligator sinensis]|uniref:Protein Atg16l2 n=1 Tax=Alligator sinensis TaxID=38654 RepID=A0A3Q0FK38_ALLSI|nr:autophagy-related protein 16-2 isoform X2 [Alligator sinensis]